MGFLDADRRHQVGKSPISHICVQQLATLKPKSPGASTNTIDLVVKKAVTVKKPWKKPPRVSQIK
jgi:hypothetical protein